MLDFEKQHSVTEILSSLKGANALERAALSDVIEQLKSIAPEAEHALSVIRERSEDRVTDAAANVIGGLLWWL